MMNDQIENIMDSLTQYPESVALSSISQETLITVLLKLLEQDSYVEEASYAVLREICNREPVSTELLLLAHSYAQYVFSASIEELDGAFLEKAQKLSPNDRRVLYSLLEKRPNIEGDPSQRDFEISVINSLLKFYPDDSIAKKAMNILQTTDKELPLDFINQLPNPLDGLDFKEVLRKLAGFRESI